MRRRTFTPGPITEAQEPRVTLVALGSSFASGPGLRPYADKAAMRSTRNYASLVAERLGTDLVDLTVAGATTATVLDSRQRLGRALFPPQILAMPGHADLVTMTIGGNDLGYLAGVLVTALGHRFDRSLLGKPLVGLLRENRPLVDISPGRLAAAEAGLIRIVEEVRRRAPHAQVLLVDYVPVFPEGTAPSPALPFSAAEIAHFQGVARLLSSVFAGAAQRSGVDLIPASAYDQGHGPGTVDPWVFGTQPLRDLGSSFHPTASGMRAVADQIVLRLRT